MQLELWAHANARDLNIYVSKRKEKKIAGFN